MFTSYGVGYSALAPTEQQITAYGRKYVAGSATGCLIFHGSTDKAISPYKTPYGSGLPGTGLMEALAQRGIPSMSADWAGANPWGNDTAIARVGDGYSWFTSTSARAAQAKTGKVLLAGFSMGACNALNWATRNLPSVAAIVIGIPVVDMQHMHDDGIDATVMETAYGGLAAWQAALPTHDPINFASTFAGVPIAAWYGDPDTDGVIRPADVEAFAAAVGSSCVLHSLGSAPHNVNLIPSADMADFLAAHA